VRSAPPTLLATLATALLLPALAAPPAAAAGSVDLVGTWYVLVHYKDDGSPNPEQERWEDKVWVFEKKGSRMRWTEYPIVVFDDETGRFERRHTGQYARVLHYWEPDAGQRADIADGLQVNPRGSKKKTLRGSDAKGWASGRASTVASASVVTYSELWQVEGMPTKPVFSRSDYLSGARTDNMEGLTRYATAEVREGGDLLVGTYTRDGRRHGTFRMMRSGEAGALKGAAKTLEERQRQALRGRLDASGIEEQARALYEEGLARSGTILSRQDMAQMEVLGWRLFRQEVSAEVAEKRIVERTSELAWGFAASDARHDDAVRYRWPFDASVPRRVLRGEVEQTMQLESGGEHHRALGREHAFDFALPEGTEVLAARAGIVRRVVDDHAVSGSALGDAWQANGVWISHADGSVAEYSHLEKGSIEVEVGDSVEAGDRIGRSGESGRVEEPSLHFAVLVMGDEGFPRAVPIRFADGTPDGVVPVAGRSYGGE